MLEALVRGGHQVLAVVRSDDSLAAVEEAGATGIVGDLGDQDWLSTQLGRVDGAIHTAAAGDETDAVRNDAVIAAVITAFGGTTKPFLLTGGAWTYGSGDDITETDPADPPQLTAWRVAQEQQLLAADLKASVIQPGIVYAPGQGIATMLASGPRDPDGALLLVGSGEQHWCTVHAGDLADLYVLVLETAPGGEAYLGVNGHNPTVREIGEAIAGRVAPGSADEASERVGAAFAEALLLDQQASGAKARELGWEPTSRSLIDVLAQG